MPPRFSEAKRRKALDIYREQGPRAAARAVGCSPGTVTKWAKAAGVETLRNEITKDATEAKQTDNAHRLEVLKGKFLQESERLLSEMTAPTKVIKFHQGDWYETDLDQPTHIDQRNIMWTAGGAIRNYLEIDAHQGGGEDSFAAVDQWLEHVTGDE